MTAPDFSDAVWRKSIRSNGTGNCVEVAWRKSSFSNGGGECVEVAQAGLVMGVRDSKNPGGPILTFPASALSRFLARP